jgi:hypothetical protein
MTKKPAKKPPPAATLADLTAWFAKGIEKEAEKDAKLPKGKFAPGEGIEEVLGD